MDELSRTRADLSAARASMADQRYAVTLQTKTLFYEALRQGELLEVARARVDQARQSLDLVREQTRLGQGTASDTLRARLELANARQAVLQAETSRRAARFSLARQIGAAAPVEPVPPDSLDPRSLPLTEQEILVRAEEAAPSVEAASFSAEAASASVAAARSAYLPSFGISSGYTWSNNQFALEQGNTSWSLRLSASYPIFNGFSREGQIQRAQDQLVVARRQEEDARLAAREQADAALQGLRTAEQAIEIAQEAVTVAREDLRVVRERYRLGVATILDLITSQIAVEQAQADAIGARYDYALARA
jgi:outer membrane protein TolC